MLIFVTEMIFITNYVTDYVSDRFFIFLVMKFTLTNNHFSSNVSQKNF